MGTLRSARVQDQGIEAAATPVGGDVAAVGEAPAMIPQGSYNRTAEEETVHEHPGCGCRVAGLDRTSTGSLAAFAAAGAALIVAGRRRMRRR